MHTPNKDVHELTGILDMESPEFRRGWRRFVANTVRESLSAARYTGTFALKNKHSARISCKNRVQEHLANGCAAWLWIDGIGNPDFSFAECCEICSLDPLAVREAFHALFDSDDDIKEIDWWVRRRCDLTGCLWAGENIHED
jgi:hypothetical protein